MNDSKSNEETILINKEDDPVFNDEYTEENALQLNDDDFDYTDEYTFDEEPKSKKKLWIIIAAILSGLILVVVIIVFATFNSKNYLEDVKIYVDGIHLRTYDKIAEDELDEQLILDGFDEENYKYDPLQTSTDKNKYLIQRKNVTITFYAKEWENQEQEVYQYTLENVLDEIGITLSENDVIYLDNKLIEVADLSKTNIRNGSDIRIVENEVKEEVEEEAIKFSTIEQNDPTLPKGETKVQTEGQDGLKRTTYKVYYLNGKEVKREVISSEIVNAPVDKVILIGTLEEDDEDTDTGEGNPDEGTDNTN